MKDLFKNFLWNVLFIFLFFVLIFPLSYLLAHFGIASEPAIKIVSPLNNYLFVNSDSILLKAATSLPAEKVEFTVYPLDSQENSQTISAQKSGLYWVGQFTPSSRYIGYQVMAYTKGLSNGDVESEKVSFYVFNKLNVSIDQPTSGAVVKGSINPTMHISVPVPQFLQERVNGKFLLFRDNTVIDDFLADFSNNNTLTALLDTTRYKDGRYSLKGKIKIERGMLLSPLYYETDSIDISIDNIDDSSQDRQSESDTLAGSIESGSVTDDSEADVAAEEGDSASASQFDQTSDQTNVVNQSEENTQSDGDAESISDTTKEVIIADIISPVDGAEIEGRYTLRAKTNLLAKYVVGPRFVVYNKEGKKIKEIFARFSGENFRDKTSFWEADTNFDGWKAESYLLEFSFKHNDESISSSRVSFSIKQKEEDINLTFKEVSGITKDEIISSKKEVIIRLNRAVGDLVPALYKDGDLKSDLKRKLQVSYNKRGNYWSIIIDPSLLEEGKYSLFVFAKLNGKQFQSEPINFKVKKTNKEDKKEKKDIRNTEEEKKDISTSFPASEKIKTDIIDNGSGVANKNKENKDNPPKKEKETEKIVKKEIPKKQPFSQKEKQEEASLLTIKKSPKINILNFEEIKRVDSDFKIKIKTEEILLQNVKVIFHYLDDDRNDSVQVIPAQREGESKYIWRADVHFDNFKAGNYEMYIEGITVGGAKIKGETKRVFFEENKNNSPEIKINPLCQENGLETQEECEMFLRLPEKCQKAHKLTKTECDRFLFVNYLPPLCQEKGATSDEECQKIIEKELNLPSLCKKEGILEKEKCDKFLSLKERQNNKASKEKEQKKPSSQKEESFSIDSKCQEEGIVDHKKCQAFLKAQNLPEECLEEGIYEDQSCQRYLEKKYILPECKRAGIIRLSDCKDFLFQKYGYLVRCSEDNPWKCKIEIKENKINEVVAKVKKIERIKAKVVRNIEKIGRVEDIKSYAGDDLSVSLRNKDTKVKVIKAEEGITLDKEGMVKSAAPVAVILDSDGDGLSDDMEKKIGTDPNNPDTDGDGYWDGTEIKNGYSPLISAYDLAQNESQDVEKLVENLAPVEKAIIEGKPIGHPTEEGEVSSDLAVEDIENAQEEGVASEKGGIGYRLRGKGIPNSYVTLYIYSDLPVVLTLKVNKYGNWVYDFKEPLSDGRHEVYVAINDNTGRVVAKSNPFSFFIKDAKAVSAKEFSEIFVPTDENAQVKKEEKIMDIYLYIILGIILLTTLFFVIFLWKKKNNDIY